jgi:hypothetical protein
MNNMRKTSMRIAHPLIVGLLGTALPVQSVLADADA